MKKEQAVSKAKLFREFIADQRILIADSNTSAAEAIKSMLESMGAKGEFIFCTPDFDSAKTEIEMFAPSILIADFTLGERRALELAPVLETRTPDASQRLCILLTSNSQQEAISAGAETEVDAAIARPIVAETFKPAFVRAALRKLQPSEYTKSLSAAQMELEKGSITEATRILEAAQLECEKPALACYYLGRAHEASNQPERAEAWYLQGLLLNPLHRKCLTGLFENLHARKSTPQTYEILKKLADTYTLTADQLTIALKLAVQLRQFQDVDRYFEIFSTLESPSEELVRFLCPALLVAGKHHLQNGMTGWAVEAFRKAATAADGRTRILREIISNLLDAKLVDQAEEIFHRSVPKTTASLDVQVMEYMIMDQLMEGDQVIERGQDLLWNKINDPIVYRILIKRSREAGQADSAAEMTAEAAQRWPDVPEFKEVPTAH